ncbi:MAG: DUF998 domain-containing protein [Ornithinimicrobium sp.]
MVQPLYLATEVAIGLTLAVSYSFRDDTISALGTGCSAVVLEGCSSQPWVMNAAFIGFGVLQAAGAWHLLWDRTSRRRQVVGAAWAVAGSFSVLVGLFPVDSHPVAHTVVAVPVFVTQPLAILLHARLFPPSPTRTAGMALGALAVAGAGAFGVLLGSDQWGGLAERVAIWPAKVWLALAVVTAVSGRAAGARSTGTGRSARTLR